jgi:hypothetical protein
LTKVVVSRGARRCFALKTHFAITGFRRRRPGGRNQGIVIRSATRPAFVIHIPQVNAWSRQADSGL